MLRLIVLGIARPGTAAARVARQMDSGGSAQLPLIVGLLRVQRRCSFRIILRRCRSSTEITGADAMVIRSMGAPTGKWNHGLVLCVRRLVMMSPLRVRRIIWDLS